MGLITSSLHQGIRRVEGGQNSLAKNPVNSNFLEEVIGIQMKVLVVIFIERLMDGAQCTICSKLHFDSLENRMESAYFVNCLQFVLNNRDIRETVSKYVFKGIKTLQF